MRRHCHMAPSKRLNCELGYGRSQLTQMAPAIVPRPGGSPFGSKSTQGRVVVKRGHSMMLRCTKQVAPLHQPHVIRDHTLSLGVLVPGEAGVAGVVHMQPTMPEAGLAIGTPLWLLLVPCCRPLSVAAITDVDLCEPSCHGLALVHCQRALI